MSSRKKKRRVLVVDDEAQMRKVLGKTLAKEGYEVRGAANGLEALEAMGKKRTDVVLLDIRMPEMDGMETLRRIRERDPQVPVVMLTAYGTLQTAREAMRLGAVDYITKPFDNDFVASVLREALTERATAKT